MSAQYFSPTGLDDAIALLAGGNIRPLAGGTDIFPALGTTPLSHDLLDISRIPALKEIVVSETGVRIGAAATWSEIVAADLPRAFDGLKAAAREVGGRQIQNAGTLAGNICNASPAADSVPPLLTLGAEVELTGPGGRRC
ncbi:MAG: FAD binding domain-containing protein, partial [Pseudomonadota bacterium]